MVQYYHSLEQVFALSQSVLQVYWRLVWASLAGVAAIGVAERLKQFVKRKGYAVRIVMTCGLQKNARKR